MAIGKKIRWDFLGLCRMKSWSDLRYAVYGRVHRHCKPVLRSGSFSIGWFGWFGSWNRLYPRVWRSTGIDRGWTIETHSFIHFLEGKEASLECDLQFFSLAWWVACLCRSFCSRGRTRCRGSVRCRRDATGEWRSPHSWRIRGRLKKEKKRVMHDDACKKKSNNKMV